MAYRRRQQAMPKASNFEDEEVEAVRNPRHHPNPPPAPDDDDHVRDNYSDGVQSSLSSSSSSSSSLAAKAIRASSAHRDTSLSSAYSAHSASRFSNPTSSSQNPYPYQYTSMKSLNESKHGVWDTFARKAKALLGEDSVEQQSEIPVETRRRGPGTATRGKSPSDESQREIESSKLQKGLSAIASSLNNIGGTIGNAFEEGLTIVEDRTADIIQETRKHIKKKTSSSAAQNRAPNQMETQLQSQMQTDQELQLKASRDVAMAMAAKAKLLLRELKTVKADLAFAKERCAQLEEENKILRENHERGDNPEDDDLIRLQLETLLAEKARLAHENSIYTRENRFLREIVEYHQLTMQDVVYLDEGTEEVTEVYPIKVTSSTSLHPNPALLESLSASRSAEAGLDVGPQMSQVIPTRPLHSSELSGVSHNITQPISYASNVIAGDTKRHSKALVSS